MSDTSGGIASAPRTSASTTTSARVGSATRHDSVRPDTRSCALAPPSPPRFVAIDNTRPSAPCKTLLKKLFEDGHPSIQILRQGLGRQNVGRKAAGVGLERRNLGGDAGHCRDIVDA